MDDDNPYGSDSPPVAASRQDSSDSSFSSIAPVYEIRNLVLARGIQFHEDDAGDYAIGTYLPQKLGAAFTTSGSGWTYDSDIQHVTFQIEEVTTKDAFKEALETDGVHVIYDGHARHGQGPCFGEIDAPGEDWGNGSDHTTKGLFRMGYPFIGIPVSDILEHQYTGNPVSGDDDKPPKDDSHPSMRAVYSKVKTFTVAEFGAGLLNYFENPYISEDDTFWGYDAISDSGKFERHIVLRSGWTSTDSDPMDLGGTDIACRVFCSIGCSTLRHNHEILRTFKAWQHEGDDRFAYWTTNVTACAPMTAFWLHRLLSFPKRNDFGAWAPSLDYAVRMANMDYVNGHFGIDSRLV